MNMAGSSETPSDAILKKYSLELLTCLDDMRHKRDVLHKQILTDEKEKDKIQDDLKHLTERLVKVNESICDKVITRCKLEETITETEVAFSKLVSGTGNLVSFMKKVTSTIAPVLEETDRKEKEAAAAAEKSKRKSKKTDAVKR